MTCPACQHENPSHAKFCLECGTRVDGTREGERRGASPADLERALAEALERENATGDVLRLISTFPDDLTPVFGTILDKALHLCDAELGLLFRYDGDTFTLAAQRGAPPAAEEALRRFRAGPTTGFGRMLAGKRTIHIPDTREEDAYRQGDPLRLATADLLGARTFLAVPLLTDCAILGAIAIYRREVRPFGERQIAVSQAFATQAVIAIENVRLFTELQEKNQALAHANTQVTEALEQQVATSEILRVISTSPTDVQPVFDAIAESSLRLLHGFSVIVWRYDGERLYPMSIHGGLPGSDVDARRFLPMLVPARGTYPWDAVADGVPCQIPDVDLETNPIIRATAQARGWRANLAVPMLHGGRPIGLITVSRAEAGRFSPQDVQLLQTFADQAVIAIENVRSFTELQARNRDLTATGEILRVISRSPTDVEPVFRAIAESAAHLTGAVLASVYEFDGALVHLRVLAPADWPHGDDLRRNFPRPPAPDFAAGRVILERSVLHRADLWNDPDTPDLTRAWARRMDLHSVLWVPMCRDGEPIGVIGVVRREPGPFSDEHVRLLQTFADQAVIAVENVRLFGELEARTAALTRSVDQLTALGEVGRAVGSTLDLETVLTTIVTRAVQLSGLDGGVVFEYDEATGEFVQRVATETGGALAEARRTTRIRKGEGVLGRTAITLEPVQVRDITEPDAYEGRLRDNLIASGIRAVLAVPMIREGRLIGCLGVTRNRPGEFAPATIELLRTFATQSALAIQNARLFHEIADKSRQLEVANRHKSEFLANMSHELRTPLNAIIGFSEVLIERMFGELNDRQDEYLRDIHASGLHLLSLINDILDLSKIEAGRMELEPGDFELPASIDHALTLVRERAGRRGVALHQAVDERLGQVRGDERKVKQVLVNLLSNALKFTSEGGRIDVRARLVDEMAEISVADTGVGIAPEDQDAVFEEFRQVGAADRKAEGTGLGLALCRKFVELHGGRIWVESAVGVGSTFTFTIPTRRDERPAGSHDGT